MKSILLLFSFFLFSGAFAHDTTTVSYVDTLSVSGNCGMCKKRIETAALSVVGVQKAEWNASTSTLLLTYDPSTCNLDLVHQAIAAVGHDTDKVKANDKTYGKLPGCCHYDRKTK